MIFYVLDADPDACVNRDGYPVHTLGNAAQEPPPNPANSILMENSYQKRWQQFQKVQSSSQSEVKSTKVCWQPNCVLVSKLF